MNRAQYKRSLRVAVMGVLGGLAPQLLDAQAPARGTPSSVARQQSTEAQLTAAERIRLRQVMDSLSREGIKSSALREIATALIVSRRGPNAPFGGKDAPAPLSIIRVTPDTALAGSEVQIVFASLLADSSSADSVRRTLVVTFEGPLQVLPAKVGEVVGTLVRVTVPDGAKRGSAYAIRAALNDERGPLYSGFVAGPSWSQTLRDPKYWLGGIIALLLIFAPVIAGYQNKRKAARDAEQFQKQLAAQRKDVDRLRFQLNVDPTLRTEPPASQADSAPAVIVPDVPDELVEVCAAGDCVLFGGIGLSQQAGLPSSVEVLAALMERSGANDETITSAMSAGRYDEVAEVLATRMRRSEILATFQTLYGGAVQRATPAHDALATIPFAGVVSTAWDPLLETAFAAQHKAMRTVTPNETSEPVTTTTTELVIAKPFGSLADPASFRFTDEEMFGAIGTNRAFASTIAFLLGTKSVLFIGTSSRRIQDFLARLQLRLEPKRPHFALLPRQTNSLLQDEILRTKYGIQVIGFDATPGFPEVAGFVRALAAAVEKAQPTAERSQLAPAVLSEVHLRNIGAFRKLDLTFGPHWNVLLGNNGSGKSTLLRAIALGLCGDDRDAERHADKLLRTGERSGTIEVVVGDITCRTELIRDGSKVRVKSQLTAFAQGKWVVLGFPPLRGVSTREPSGLTAPSESRPVVGDLLPLIRGSIDERLNDLKQWIVNVDADANNSASPNQQRSKALREGFFDLLRKVTPGVTLDFAQVSRDPWRVLVKTEDGDVSIDQVSQGMSSIFGWVGTMLQRMYEIHAGSEEPRKEPAVVLVDELEAHLHPEWQQRIVALIREFFPKLQIIATSHSPLVVVGMKANEVYIARRNRDDRSRIEINPVPPEIDFASLRADQILTSELFGLSTTRGPEASRLIEEYTVLRAKPQPTESETRRIAELRDRLLGLHGPEENPARRQVTEAVTKTLREMVDKSLLTKDGEIAPELAHEVRQRLDKVMLPSSDQTVQEPQGGATR